MWYSLNNAENSRATAAEGSHKDAVRASGMMDGLGKENGHMTDRLDITESNRAGGGDDLGRGGEVGSNSVTVEAGGGGGGDSEREHSMHAGGEDALEMIQVSAAGDNDSGGGGAIGPPPARDSRMTNNGHGRAITDEVVKALVDSNRQLAKESADLRSRLNVLERNQSSARGNNDLNAGGEVGGNEAAEAEGAGDSRRKVLWEDSRRTLLGGQVGSGQVVVSFDNINIEQTASPTSPPGPLGSPSDESFRRFLDIAQPEQTSSLERDEGPGASERDGEDANSDGDEGSMESAEVADLLRSLGQSARPDQRFKSMLHEISSRRSIWKFERFTLPNSTYTWLITEEVGSLPFVVAIVAMGLAVTSLVIVLKNETDNFSDVSPWGLPAGVSATVRIAQYVGITIGVLMEEEIPLGLELIGRAIRMHMQGTQRYSTVKVVISSLLRLVVGYLFLSCLFFSVLQESDALAIFFDVLALEFVERMDDVIHELSKRGFFGKKLRVAAYGKHKFDPTWDATKNTFGRWMLRSVGTVYFLNMGLMVIFLSILAYQQDTGAYRCGSIYISFMDDLWEGSWVGNEQRLLLYSHFSGIYKENGIEYGRPKYIEMNKENGKPFMHTIPAELKYCKPIKSWVIMHPNISTTPLNKTKQDDADEKENECQWLLRSHQTDSFDVIEVAEGSWSIWTGKVEDHKTISITCNECYGDSDCNYHGICNKAQCECDHHKYFGIHCEYDRPCEVIRSEKDSNMTLHLLHDNHYDDDLHFLQVYGHPKYIREDMSGIPSGLMKLGVPTDDIFVDDDFFDIHMKMASFEKMLANYTFVMKYTGRRWYGRIQKPGLSAKNFHEEEYHAFWDNTFSGLGVDDNSTVIISGPGTDASPVALDFYEMRRRNKEFENGKHNYNYSPFGVLIPLISTEGAGYFHCNAEDGLH